MTVLISRRTILATAVGAACAPLSADSAIQQTGQIPGKIAFTRDANIWVWEGGSAREVVSGGNISDPRWSPDGKRMLYVRMQNSYSDISTSTT